MNLTILVEQLDSDKFRAETSQPVSLTTEGSSREEAIQRLRELAERRLQGGELVRVEIKGNNQLSPWTRFAGVWKNHPEFDQYVENVAEYRRQVDENQS
jgi:predicted RNase H-like HicB family nuclease